MKRFAKFLAVCALIVGGVYLAYLLVFPTAYLRYRLTVDVDVDGVTRTGSGVVEISYQPLPDSFVGGFGASNFRGDMRGYAITIDLGERGMLFVVNAWPMLAKPGSGGNGGALFPGAANLASLPMVAYGLPQTGLPSHMMGLVRELSQKTGSVDVPPEKLPMLLRFRDTGDRHSNEELDPRDLAAALGPGVRLARARLEFTNDPVSPMPRSWPNWLVDEKGEEGFMLHAYSGDLYRSFWCSNLMFKGK
jgi:hypothetical protein